RRRARAAMEAVDWPRGVERFEQLLLADGGRGEDERADQRALGRSGGGVHGGGGGRGGGGRLVLSSPGGPGGGGAWAVAGARAGWGRFTPPTLSSSRRTAPAGGWWGAGEPASSGSPRSCAPSIPSPPRGVSGFARASPICASPTRTGCRSRSRATCRSTST